MTDLLKSGMGDIEDPIDRDAYTSPDHKIDLISMGASGQSGITERLLGSTTDRVTRSVDTSVFIARP